MLGEFQSGDFGLIVMSLIELRAVKEFVRIIAKCPIVWRSARSLL